MLPLSLPSPPSDWATINIPLGFIHDALVGIFPWFPTQFVIHMYAIAILVGIIVAIVVSNYRLTKRGAEPWLVVDLAIWAVVFGIIGSRAWHVVTHPDDYFGPGKNTWDVTKPGSVWAVWEGGVAIFGAVLFGALGVYIACRIAGLRFTAAVDAMAPTLLLAQAFGRLGNYFNQELFGLPTDLPWGLEIDRPNSAIPVGLPDDTLFHPTFLYEIIWLLAGFAILMAIENRVSFSKVATGIGRFLPIWPTFVRRDAWRWGKMVGLYLIWYGIGRSWFESIRLDPSETFLGIRSNVWGALAAIVVGLLILIIQSKSHVGLEPSVYRPGKEWKPDSAVDSDEIYSDSDEPGDGAGSPAVPATSGATRK
ncbi:MAG: prolipoprotein diacylglyceryl transferase [Pseudolysinimonas sp.]|uniref:prolipoprotein diacylglyceryl transferase n=1 Tax=Pseudolysinimonas sp. TaxID=2680009 RepID=UPI0032631484